MRAVSCGRSHLAVAVDGGGLYTYGDDTYPQSICDEHLVICHSCGVNSKSIYYHIRNYVVVPKAERFFMSHQNRKLRVFVCATSSFPCATSPKYWSCKGEQVPCPLAAVNAMAIKSLRSYFTNKGGSGPDGEALELPQYPRSMSYILHHVLLLCHKILNLTV